MIRKEIKHILHYGVESDIVCKKEAICNKEHKKEKKTAEIILWSILVTHYETLP